MPPKYTVWIPKSSLFHSRMVPGKKNFLNEFVLEWYVGISSELQVFYEWDSGGINWKICGGSP